MPFRSKLQKAISYHILSKQIQLSDEPKADIENSGAKLYAMTEQTFDREKTINYWLECAVYDLDTGKSLLESKRYPYALFFGHLALEKALKALVVKESGEHAPFTHSLMMLAQKANIEQTEDLIDNLAEYTSFNIEARYPDEKKTFYDQCTKEFAYEKFTEMEELYKWLIKKSGEK